MPVTEHTEETKQKISASNTGKVRTKEVREQISLTKKNDKELPMYVSEFYVDDVKGYRILGHPMFPHKKEFRDTGPDWTDQKRRQAALDFIQMLNECTEVYHERTLPKYMQQHARGYCVKIPKMKTKFFFKHNVPLETRYQQALDYLNEHLPKDAVQRVDVSGSE